MANQKPTLDTWKHRRRLLWATWGYCAIHAAVGEWAFGRTAIEAWTLMGALVMAYVFGAIIDDWKKEKK